MENRQQPSFTAYEYAKMASLIADSMAKIEKVLETLQMAKEHKNIMLLLQVLDNLNRVYTMILGYGRIKAKQQARKTIERAKEILGEKPGG